LLSYKYFVTDTNNLPLSHVFRQKMSPKIAVTCTYSSYQHFYFRTKYWRLEWCFQIQPKGVITIYTYLIWIILAVNVFKCILAWFWHLKLSQYWRSGSLI